MQKQIIKFLIATKEAQKIEPTMYSYQDIIKRSKRMQNDESVLTKEQLQDL